MDNVKELLKIMKTLRDPQDGCAWDVEQTFNTLAPHTIEEAYEVAEAIEQGDMVSLKDELGDLLFQVIFHSQLAEEAGHFNFSDVVDANSEKMRRRHPHVFADESFRSSDEQVTAWEKQKETERTAKNQNGILDGITKGLPALTRAIKIQKRAARVGFDWPKISQVIDKLNEEMLELSEELVKNIADQTKIKEEFGDMMFVYANLARHLKIDPEEALRAANNKFINRFNKIEEIIDNKEKKISSYSLDELEKLWNEVKKEERS